MNEALYSARVGESHFFADRVGFDELVNRIVEFTIRAAVARSVDESSWEQEELRRGGLRTIQIFRGGKAIWADSHAFESELGEARREGIQERFERANAVDPEVYERLDQSLIDRWRRAGYDTPSLASNMKALFDEVGREATDRAESAREDLVVEILRDTVP